MLIEGVTYVYRETKLVWVKAKELLSTGQLGMQFPPPSDRGYKYPSSVPTGRVLFEIGGIPIREELARDSKPKIVYTHNGT
jgi:hypothetical protein